MKLNKFLLLLLTVSLTTIFAVFLFYEFYLVQDVVEYDMKIIVSDKIGFDVTTESLHFGMVFPGGGSNRKVIISHNSDIPLKVLIKFDGKLGETADVSENGFILLPNEKKEVSFSVIAPSVSGDYEGKAKIIFRKVLFS